MKEKTMITVIKESDYVQHEHFRKMNKTERLNMKAVDSFYGVEIKQLLLIPTRKKMSGYGVGAFFGLTKKGWLRFHMYDCWSITTDINDPIDIKYTLLRGDFEYGGINIFSFVDNEKKAVFGYGGELKITKQKND